MVDIEQKLARVTGALPGGGETRPGQLKMAELVTDAVTEKRPILIEAGTGTGKSLAYLTPIVVSGRRTVVATATIALQVQLVETDLPQVAKGLDREVSVAILKGRGNYLCRQRLNELQRADRTEQLQLLGGRNPDRHMGTVVAWAGTTATGDREELDPAPSSDIWGAVSVGADECPGGTRCPSGDECFSEQARQRALAADVIVTNHHYYGLDISSGGALLPEHDIVVFDEAHQLPEVLGATCGTELSGSRFRALSRRVRSVLTDEDLPLNLDRSAAELEDVCRPMTGSTADDMEALVAILVTGRDRADKAIAALRKLNPTEGSDVASRIERATLASTRLVADIDSILEAEDSDVLWVDGNQNHPVLRRTPMELESLLDEALWPNRAVVLTSATLADGILPRLGLGQDHGVQRVGSPFDYQNLAVLYCPTDLPSPREPTHRAAVQDEILDLVRAAGGRTLALFTSYTAMSETAERFADELDLPVLVQGESPKAALIEKFKADPKAILLATLSFWQGVDLPGPTLTLVTIDRLPFPRPDEPVTQALRDRAGPAAFREVDLPRAQTLLAQAAGRLIRKADDRGVVAVLDPRLATSKAYRWELVNALPPMRRTKDRQEVLGFLRELDQAASDRSAQA